MKVEWYGMSGFLITSDNGTRIVTDPYIADMNVLYNEIHELADVVTVSCGHYSHCNVYSVNGEPYIYRGPEPAEIKGIKFYGVATSHLVMEENKYLDAGQNMIMCFDVDGVKLCHLGALGHDLSEQQIEQIGEVDILLIPVGGYSTMPVDVVTKVSRELKPKVIIPMHYRSERCTFPTWAGVDEFLEGKENVIRMDSHIGSSELEFYPDTIPAATQILVLRPVY